MRSERIVEGFNVSEDSSLGSAPGSEALEMNHFTLEAAKEVLRDSVVIGISFVTALLI